ncbi:hypothetical protein M1D52_15940 [Olivibacter sp. SA151]|uniref:hypothetical protein n=1 Tax=Olivibacter jilunii TaxID=985016 RepID=UPI0012FA903E
MKYFPSLTLPMLALFMGISCSSDNGEMKVTHPPYFDLISYFKQEAQFLQKKNPLILKTVGKNEQREQKKLRLGDWQREFELFSSSDINKPDWLQSYRIDSADGKLSYRAKAPRLRTKQITIYKDPKGAVRHIQILNGEKNWLYESSERLDYFPDSLYEIEKEQSIRIIGRNNYIITGRIL